MRAVRRYSEGMKIEIEISEDRRNYIWTTDGDRSGGAQADPMPPIVIAGYLSAIITDLIIDHFRPDRRKG